MKLNATNNDKLTTNLIKKKTNRKQHQTQLYSTEWQSIQVTGVLQVTVSLADLLAVFSSAVVDSE